MEINTLTQTQTIIYSFTAGYMVSQLNILGFALGCGFMYALNYIPNRLTNNAWNGLDMFFGSTFFEKKVV
jgi:hypothetical protein